MGRAASKAKKNIYYLARMEAAGKEKAFSSRESASVRLGIERSRLARIELDKISPYPEEVLNMAIEYKAPYLCDDYCKNVCAIGMNRAMGKRPGDKKKESFERLTLRFVSSANSVEEVSRKLIDISKDGKVSREEYESFHKVLSSLNDLAVNIREIKAYIMSDPELKARFGADLMI